MPKPVFNKSILIALKVLLKSQQTHYSQLFPASTYLVITQFTIVKDMCSITCSPLPLSGNRMFFFIDCCSPGSLANLDHQPLLLTIVYFTLNLGAQISKDLGDLKTRKDHFETKQLKHYTQKKRQFIENIIFETPMTTLSRQQKFWVKYSLHWKL